MRRPLREREAAAAERVEAARDPEDGDLISQLNRYPARGPGPDGLDRRDRLGSLVRSDHGVPVAPVVDGRNPLTALLRSAGILALLGGLARDRRVSAVRPVVGDVLDAVGEVVAVEDVLLEAGTPADDGDSRVVQVGGVEPGEGGPHADGEVLRRRGGAVAVPDVIPAVGPADGDDRD